MNVLLVSAHPDDAEISCGGTIAKLEGKGHIVWSLYFAPCTEDPKNKGHLEDHRKAVKVLGIDNLIEYNFPRNELEYYKQNIRDILWELKQTFKPDAVFCPSPHDRHQDHKAVADCCLTIFRNALILGYECLASCPNFSSDFFVELSSDNVLQKLRAIANYKSQLKGRGTWCTLDNFKVQTQLRGAYIRTLWAEAFEFMWCGGKGLEW